MAQALGPVQARLTKSTVPCRIGLGGVLPPQPDRKVVLLTNVLRTTDILRTGVSS